jgi:thiamine biosynthesis lipoprotein
MAVATSGDYERFVEIEDEKISHIIDPSTSSSAKKYTSVTIIAPTAMQADALATAVSIMEPDKAIEMIESLENVEALLIPSGEEIEYIYTEGIKKYIDTSQDYSADSSASRMTSPDQSIE